MTYTNGHPSGNGATHPLSVEQFAAYLEKRLILNDDVIDMVHRDGRVLHLRVQGRDVATDVATFYAAYINNPDHLDMIVQTFVRSLLDAQPDRTDHSYASLAERVYPMLKPISILASVRERSLPMLVYREFLADLIIAYVIDESRSVTYINEDHLARWDIGAHELHEQALHNLQRRTETTNFITAGEGTQRLFIFNSNDGYDATRLLLTDVLAQWAAQVSGNLLIGVPNRDFLIAFGDSDQDVVQAVAQQVQSDAAQRDYGLTEQLFIFQNGHVREYQWE